MSERTFYRIFKLATGKTPQTYAATKKTPFFCPSGIPKSKWGGYFGMNSIIVPFSKPSDIQKRAVGISKPASTLLIADSPMVYINEEFLTTGVNATHGTPAFRHDDSANVLFLDGHIGNVTKEQCQDPAFRKTLMGQQ